MTADGRLQNKQVETRISPSAEVIHDVILRQGENELARPSSALAWSGLAAGLSMGFSLVAEGLLRSMLPDVEWRPLITKFGYSLGFLIVIIGKQQLFTENTLTPIIPVMANMDRSTLLNVARLWVVVLLANMLGVHLMAWCLADTAVISPHARQAFFDIANEAMQPAFGEKLLRGIFAGWLIALLVWILGAAKSEGTAIVLILTYIVGLAGFTHVIAGTVEALFLFWSGHIGWWDAVGGYTVPALIGNTLGGVSLVAAINHAQVMAGKTE